MVKKYVVTLKNISRDSVMVAAGLMKPQPDIEFVEYEKQEDMNLLGIGVSGSSGEKTRCYPVMYDRHGETMPDKTDKPCYQCRLTFSNTPIGCPVAYYQSIDRETHTELEAYSTERSFCCTPCVKSYILDQIKLTQSPVYRQSMTMLKCMTRSIEEYHDKIPVAKPCSLMITWGGLMTPQEYRSSQKLYTHMGCTNRIMGCIPSGFYLTEG